MATNHASRTVEGICVGVDKPGLLHDLSAAGSGARLFHEWLLSQGRHGVQVKSTLLTDATGPVTRRQILDTVALAVKNRACDVLFLYLAGHGVAHSAYEEKLLLSDVAHDDAEAINLQVLKHRSLHCGIPHVVIVYDACRSYAHTDRLRQIGGGPIFPNGAGTRIGGHVDVFHACAPDESAYEIAPDSGAHPANYKAFFTDVLLKALQGADGSLLQPGQLASRPVSVIPSGRLERLLEQQVPLLAAEAEPAFDQSPDIQVLSQMPEEYFAVLPRAPGPPVGPPPSLQAGRAARLMGLALKHFETDAGRVVRPPRRPPGQVPGAAPPRRLHPGKRVAAFTAVANEVRATRGRNGFETHCGFTVIGAPVLRFEASNQLAHEPETWDSKPGEQHFRVGAQAWDARGGTALIQFQGGTGVALAVMPGYVGTVLVRDGLVRALTYVPSRGAREFEWYQKRRPALEARRAIASAAASVGRLQALGQQGGDALINHRRVDRAIDPCLGVLAAHAYHLAGRPDEVRSVWTSMSDAVVTPQGVPEAVWSPVPFDVAMLAGRLDRAHAASRPGIAPCCPWLSLGWSLLEMFDLRLHPAIVEAARHRNPGTWTSFSARGIAVLREAMQAGEIQ